MWRPLWKTGPRPQFPRLQTLLIARLWSPISHRLTVSNHPLLIPNSQVQELPRDAGARELADALGPIAAAELPATRPMWDAVLIPEYQNGAVVVLRSPR